MTLATEPPNVGQLRVYAGDSPTFVVQFNPEVGDSTDYALGTWRGQVRQTPESAVILYQLSVVRTDVNKLLITVPGAATTAAIAGRRERTDAFDIERTDTPTPRTWLRGEIKILSDVSR